MLTYPGKINLAFISLIALLIFTLACNAVTGGTPTSEVDQISATPVSLAQPTSTSVAAFETANGGGVTFQYPTDLISSVNVSQVAAETDTPIPHPAYTEFSLLDYPIYSDDVRGAARIQVYPIEEFIKLSPIIADDLKALKELKSYELPDEMPFPHILNARPIFYERSTGTFLPGGLSGYLFLTQFGQDVSPITNDGLTYVFVGQNENDHLIVAFFPVHAPGLPASFSDIDLDQWQNNIPEYMSGVKKDLRFLQPDEFSPSLTVLDNIIFSIADGQANQEPNSASSGPILGSIEETQKAREEQTRTLTQAADEKYAGKLKVGETQQYMVRVSGADERLRWYQGWCATDSRILAQNLKNMEFELQVNGQTVNLDGTFSEYYKSSDGMSCFAYSTVLYGWPSEATNIISKLIFLSPVNDGASDYAAGEMTKIFMIINP